MIFFLSACVSVLRTLDDSVYRIALSLAKRYNVPLWEVYMTHLEFLFTDSGYTHTEKHQHVSSFIVFILLFALCLSV